MIYIHSPTEARFGAVSAKEFTRLKMRHRTRAQLQYIVTGIKEPQVNFRYGGWFHVFDISSRSLSGY